MHKHQFGSPAPRADMHRLRKILLTRHLASRSVVTPLCQAHVSMLLVKQMYCCRCCTGSSEQLAAALAVARKRCIQQELLRRIRGLWCVAAQALHTKKPSCVRADLPAHISPRLQYLRWFDCGELSIIRRRSTAATLTQKQKSMVLENRAGTLLSTTTCV